MSPFQVKPPPAKTFEDFRQEISIIELAAANGYVHEEKKGRRTPVFYHPRYQDRIIIINPRNPANQGYWNPADDTDKGSLVNFVKRRLGTVFPRDMSQSENANVNSVLYQYLRLPAGDRSRNRQPALAQALENVEPARFLLDHYKLQPLAHTGFLHSRHIAAATLKLPEFAGRIYNVQRKDPARPGLNYINTAFPYYGARDDRIVGLEIRNDNFKRHAAGSDRSHGVWHSNMPATLERMVLVESALDALAYQELNKPENTLYVSYGGSLTLNQVQTIRELKARGNPADNFQFVAASDNDEKGAWYDLMLIRELAAGWLPSQRLASERGYIKLAFPCCSQTKPDASGPWDWDRFAHCLAGNLKLYNDAIDGEICHGRLSRLVAFDLEKGKIRFRLEPGQLVAEVPGYFFALHLFNQKLIQAAGLDREIRLDKAQLKDFNEDLKLLRLINKNGPLLARLNYEVLQKGPQEPLGYQDLKEVLLQPGRQEQIETALNLLKEREEYVNPEFKPGSPGIKSSGLNI